jgi:CRISPR/Cas system-associated exonuclease Cas4 (RecB family)
MASQRYFQLIPGNIEMLTWNEIQAYRSCPLYFRYEHRDVCEPEQIAGLDAFERGVGNAVNEHYEKYFADEDEKLEYREQLDAYRFGFDSYPPETLRYATGESQQRFEALASVMLDAFAQSSAASPTESLVYTGYRFYAKLCDGLPPLQSYANLVLRNKTGGLMIQVLKLAEAPWTEADLLANRDQLLLLGELARIKSKGCKPKLRFLVISKSEQPVVQIVEVPFDTRATSRAKAMFIEVAKAISGERYFPNPSPAKCTSCKRPTERYGA